MMQLPLSSFLFALLAPLTALALSSPPPTPSSTTNPAASSSAGLTTEPQPGSASTDASNSSSDNQAGASGVDTDFIHVSQGAEVAIVVVVVLVAVIGRKSLIPSPGQDITDIGIVASALLFYLAKKRQWEVRKSIRRSAKRFTGSFKPSAQGTSRKQRGLSKIVESPPPRGMRDVEKGNKTTITSTFEVESPTPRSWRQALSFGRKPSR